MNTPVSVRLLLLFVCAIALSYSVDSTRAQNVERWINPGFGHNVSACDICGIDTYENKNEANYPTVLREIDVFQFFINDLYNLGNYLPDPDQLKIRAGIFRKYGIRVSAEATGLNDILTDDPNGTTYCQQSGVPKDYASVAHASARQDLAKMQGIYDASGKLDYLALDNPIARVLQGPYGNLLGCEFSLHDAIQALIIYMQDIHNGTGGYQGHPDIRIGMTVGFPNVNYQGIPRSEGPDPNIYDYNGIDYADVLSEAVNDIRAAGETLWFLHADSPYNYFFKSGVDSQTYINRLAALQNQARGLNLRFGVMFQSAVDVDSSDHSISDQAYGDQTKAYIQAFQAAGGNPDDFVIESCYNTPYYTYPETAQNSFMNLVLQVVPYWGYDHGNFRRLDPDIFNWREYLSFYPDIQAFVNQNYPTQQQYGAEWHWLNYGVFEGRDGSRPFFSQEYLAVNPDLSYYGNNWAGAIDHWFLYGRNDGWRRPRYSSDCNVAYSGVNNVVGLNNGAGDQRFLCYEGRWYDSGWEGNDPSWEFKAYNNQLVGHYKCNLPYSRWDYVP